MEPQIFRIVFEDSDFLVIEKLAGFLSQRGDKGDGEGLYEFISRVRGIPLYPVHRLDRDVLGLMIFGKSSKAADALSDLFRNREIKKGYWARVKGRVYKDKDTLVHYLKKNSKNNYVTVFPKPTEGAKRAELSYVLLSYGEGFSEIFIWLKTGRSHQIRAQLAKIGHPIVGDSKYFKKTTVSEDLGGGGERIQLRSSYLEFRHPFSGERMAFSLEPVPPC